MIDGKIRIGLLVGGQSKEREGSLKSGEAVRGALIRLGYNNICVIDPQKPNFIEQILKCDCIFNALHGQYGEDGKIQGLLECLGIKYTGAGVLASAVGMNKLIFKKLLIGENIPTPAYYETGLNFIPDRIRKYPVIIKPVEEGGSIGIKVVNNVCELDSAVKEIQQIYTEIFIEEFINGKFLSVGVCGKYHAPEVMSIVEVEYHTDLYDYKTKHNAELFDYIVPASISSEGYSTICLYAEKIYKLLGCHGIVRIDFLYENKDHIYVLEINTNPGLSIISNLYASARGAGLSYEQLIEKILESADNRPSYLP